MKKIQIRRYVIEKKNILTSFSNVWAHSLILHQNSVSGPILKVNCNVKSKITPINFLYYVALKSTGLHLNRSFTDTGFCNIMHSSSEKYQLTKLCRSSKRQHSLSHEIKTIIFGNITNLTRTAFKY